MVVSYSALGLERICLALIVHDLRGAKSLASAQFPLISQMPRSSLPILTQRPKITTLLPSSRYKRQATPAQLTDYFVRDGFVDRYSGELVVYPPALLLLSLLLPQEFPYHGGWKLGECHSLYWSLFATYDHRIPIARGGADVASNCYTCSMQTNKQKDYWLLDELGWQEHPQGNVADWDGLLHWFVAYLRYLPGCLSIPDPTAVQINLIRNIQRWQLPAQRMVNQLAAMNPASNPKDPKTNMSD